MKTANRPLFHITVMGRIQSLGHDTAAIAMALTDALYESNKDDLEVALEALDGAVATQKRIREIKNARHN